MVCKKKLSLINNLKQSGAAFKTLAKNNMKNSKTTTIDLVSIRAKHQNSPQFSTGNTHEAVICKSYYNQGKSFAVCVNYWMPSEIQKGERTVFGDYQELIEKLYL